MFNDVHCHSPVASHCDWTGRTFVLPDQHSLIMTITLPNMYTVFTDDVPGLRAMVDLFTDQCDCKRQIMSRAEGRIRRGRSTTELLAR